MKTLCLKNLLKFTAVLLFLAGTFACTEKKQEAESIPVKITEYSLEGTEYRWTNLDYNGKVIIINSNAELEKYITGGTDGNFPYVDFSKHTLLLVSGTSNYGVWKIHTELLSTRGKYVLKIEITQNDATVLENWHISLFTATKLSENANIELNVITIRN